MAQNLGDLGQGDPGVGHLASKGVAKPVRPDDRHARPHTGATHDARDPIRAERPDRRDGSQEHLTMHGAVLAPSSQVGGDRLTDVVWQRELVFVTALAVNHDLAGPPVNVIEAEVGDLASPQPETEQDEQDGVVPPTLGPSSVARTKQGSSSLPVDPHRQ